MATALGITADAASQNGCGYVGWYGTGWGNAEEYTGSSIYAGIICDTFAQLAAGNPGQGYWFEFARQWIQDNRPSYRETKPDIQRYHKGDAPYISSFFNWRFWGNNGVRLF